MIFADAKLTIISFVVLLVCFFSLSLAVNIFLNIVVAKLRMCINCRFSDNWFLGFAVLDPIYGETVSTGLVVAIISIIVNAITIPIGLFLLNPSDAEGKRVVAVWMH